MPSQTPKHKKLSEIGEFGLINLLSKQLHSSAKIICGIGDDAAVFEFSKKQYGLLTTDMLVEGVHFKRTMPARAIGHKALACNISDIAAMGGIPKYAVVSLGVSGAMKQSFIKDVYAGMDSLARQCGVSIVGGDTVRSSRLILNVALFGAVGHQEIVYRCGAQEGDKIFVTGPLGNSYASGHHLRFTPRLKESQLLVRHFHPTSMIDISDGLLADLGHVLAASQKGALLYETQIPLRKGADISGALSDGEDFELLFTLPARESEKLRKVKTGTHFVCIGEIAPMKFGLQILGHNGKQQKLTAKGYRHF